MRRQSARPKLAQPARQQLTIDQSPSTDNFQYCGQWNSYLNSRWALESSVDPLPGTSVDPPLPECSSVNPSVSEEPVEHVVVDVVVENEPLKEEEK